MSSAWGWVLNRTEFPIQQRERQLTLFAVQLVTGSIDTKQKLSASASFHLDPTEPRA
jgi:hypothetical protein